MYTLCTTVQASFGDFSIFRMDEILEGRFNGGFARAATVGLTSFPVTS